MKASAKTNRPSSRTFHAVTHVWGRPYLDTFLNTCIPNQLAPGNVPALPSGSRYRILTRSIHVAELEGHPNVKALRSVIPVDVITVEALDRDIHTAAGYDLHTECHRRAIADALDADAAVMFLSADFVLSQDALAAVVQRHAEGCRAVATTGLRLNKEAFLLHLAESGAALGALTSRQLVRLALPHLHAHTESMFIDARAFSTFPVAAYWRIGNEGLLARCLHLHPLMVDPVSRVQLTGTADGRYLSRACPDFSRIHVVTDSDELQMFELTPADRDVIATTRTIGPAMAVWRTAVVASRCDDLQIEFWRRHVIRIHSESIGDRWASAAAEAERFARRVLWCCRPFGIPAPGGVAFLERSRQVSERQLRLLRRRLPRIPLKSIMRPVRLAKSRVSKSVRKTTRQLARHVGAHSR